jgi:hypothetical protein
MAGCVIEISAQPLIDAHDAVHGMAQPREDGNEAAPLAAPLQGHHPRSTSTKKRRGPSPSGASQPSSSMTGSRLTRRASMSLAASPMVASSPIVTAGLLMKSFATAPCERA